MKQFLLPVVLATALTGCTFAPANYQGNDAPRTETIAPIKSARPLIGLVLGAGGARGFAHVGVLKALGAAGIEPDIVVGTSSGALVASLYAGGLNEQAIEDMAYRLEDSDLFDYTLFGPGKIEGERLQDFINRALGDRPIEKLNKPFAAVATEAGTQRMAVFNRGNTGIAVRASASIPNLFWPVIIRGAEYIDGGFASRVPALIARQMGADIVIAVDLSRAPVAEADTADVVIRPRTIRSRVNDFKHKLENINAGEEATLAVVSDIRARVASVAIAKAQAASVGNPVQAVQALPAH
jgi:NTE family protein